ncbi:MAG: malonyl-ACP O-methyltransferase BioC [Burkholderiales bacterium]|nr:malonyl-ACP O-methyltransferase BioC [Burkholderiales bacterium]
MSESHEFDKRNVRRSFERAAATYDAAAVLQREVERRMFERLDYVKLAPATVLDAGSGTGTGARELARRYPRARLIALDIALTMLEAARGPRSLLQRLGVGRSRIACVCADVERLPLKGGSVDLIWSNATLQWATDLPATLKELRRVLRPGGLLMFSTFGPDTLKELRAAFAASDGHSHVNRFVDMHDIGDLLVQARLADPVMDMEHITMTYGTVRDLMRDLKAIGAHNVTAGRPRGLGGRQALAAVEQYYEAWRRNGVLPATYEVVYGHAWAPTGGPELTAEGHAVVQFHRRALR